MKLLIKLPNWYYPYGKRLFDIFAASLGLILFSPILLIIILIFFIRREKPFFFQLRPGKDEKLFTLIKFRTMREPLFNENIHDVKRITSFGKWLRMTSLDELPQLINVLKGDMSIVGPRPLLIEYLPLYTEKEKIRHKVKPGLTGYAQIKGRNLITWKQKFALDIYYVENLSFWLDLYILALTPFAISGTQPSQPYNGLNCSLILLIIFESFKVYF